MAQCFVLGESVRSGPTAEILEKSGISARAFVMVSNNPTFFDTCRQEKDLRVVALFCRDFPDDGTKFLQTLKASVANSNIRFHALYEGVGKQTVVSIRFNKLADDVHVGLPIRPVDAATIIRKRWFSELRGLAEQKKPSQVATASVAGTTVGDTSASRVARDKRVAERPHRSAQPIETNPPQDSSNVIRLLPSVFPEKTALMSTLECLLSGIKKNSPLPREPVTRNITGLAGVSVELDARRVKPLPDNPRRQDNEGFSPEKLRDLAASMKLFGQLEDGLVCPIIDDPDYDAQLIDGECRYRASQIAGIMFRVTVREEINPDMQQLMYLVSVARNTQKHAHTTLEYIGMVRNLRGSKYGLTLAETATFFGKSTNWVVRHEMLSRLQPEVQLMLDDRQESKGDTDSDSHKPSGKKLTSQLALLLVDIESEEQLAVAKQILVMNYNQARRYVLNLRRGLGLAGSATAKSKTRPSQHFQAFATLTRRSIDMFGVFHDMPTAEMVSVMVGRTKGERNGLVEDLEELIETLQELRKGVEVEE